MFFYEICEIFMNNFFPAAASVHGSITVTTATEKQINSTQQTTSKTKKDDNKGTGTITLKHFCCFYY